MSLQRGLQPGAASVEEIAGAEHRVSESPYLTAAEAARYLRYTSVRALYKAIPQLGIPCLRRGGKTFLFDRRDLDRWLRGGSVRLRRVR